LFKRRAEGKGKTWLRKLSNSQFRKGNKTTSRSCRPYCGKGLIPTPKLNCARTSATESEERGTHGRRERRRGQTEGTKGEERALGGYALYNLNLGGKERLRAGPIMKMCETKQSRTQEKNSRGGGKSSMEVCREYTAIRRS